MANESMPEEKILKIETGADNPILRKKCEIIKEITPEIKNLISEMLKTCVSSGGVGLAANQVGKSLRLFVIYAILPEKGELINAYLNPEIINMSGRKIAKEEGCLSLPGISSKAARMDKLTLEYTDENGVKKTIQASGLKARIMQHEIDHLNGILICDKISN